MARSYSHLPAPFHRLPGDVLRFWGDQGHREHVLRAVLIARDAPARAAALQTIDDAVTQGLAALGFPRAPLRSLSLVSSHRAGMAGMKYATCDLRLSLPVMQREMRPGGSPDAIVETWIHESVHGRRFPWGSLARAEASFPGFEEGLAEGITRFVSRGAGFVPGLIAYGRYVQAYEELPDVIGVSAENVYRRLYQIANGSVMDGFVSAIDSIGSATGLHPLTQEQRGRLDQTARQLFDLAYQQDQASARASRSIRRAWRRAFR